MKAKQHNFSLILPAHFIQKFRNVSNYQPSALYASTTSFAGDASRNKTFVVVETVMLRITSTVTPQLKTTPASARKAFVVKPLIKYCAVSKNLTEYCF